MQFDKLNETANRNCEKKIPFRSLNSQLAKELTEEEIESVSGARWVSGWTDNGNCDESKVWV